MLHFEQEWSTYPKICLFQQWYCLEGNLSIILLFVLSLMLTFFLIMIKRLIEHAVKEKYEKGFILSPDFSSKRSSMSIWRCIMTIHVRWSETLLPIVRLRLPEILIYYTKQLKYSNSLLSTPFNQHFLFICLWDF